MIHNVCTYQLISTVVTCFGHKNTVYMIQYDLIHSVFKFLEEYGVKLNLFVLVIYLATILSILISKFLFMLVNYYSGLHLSRIGIGEYKKESSPSVHLAICL